MAGSSFADSLFGSNNFSSGLLEGGGLGSALTNWLDARALDGLSLANIWKTGMPAAKSNHAAAVDGDYAFITIVCVVFFVPITIALFYLAYRYKKAPGEKAESDVSHNTPLEVTWTVIPMIIVVVMFYLGFKHANYMYAAPADSYTIHVTASQWTWNFKYPTGGESSAPLMGDYTPDREARVIADKDAGLHLPPGVPIRIVMGSKDVLHSFFIPEFRVKMDVVPGKRSSLWFTPDIPTGNKPDMYWLYCTEYCGDDHSNMLSTVWVHPTMESFLEWHTRRNAIDFTDPVEAGEILYARKGCGACHSIDPDGGGPKIGPTWVGLWGASAAEHPVREGSPDGPLSGLAMTGEAGEAYLYDSIVNPSAQWRDGYKQPMPNVNLSDEEINALIEYIKSLGKSE